MDKKQLEELHKEILRLQVQCADMCDRKDMTGFPKLHKRLSRLLQIYKKEKENA